MFKYKIGNILDTEAKYILNPVNCVGTMGKGLALQIIQNLLAHIKKIVKMAV